MRTFLYYVEYIFCGWKTLDERGWRIGRLVQADRKAIVAKKSISEPITRRILKQINFISSRPHRVSLVSRRVRNWGYNRKLRLQILDNRKWENLFRVWWISISSIWSSDTRGRISLKPHERMACTNGYKCGVGSVIVWVIFSWHTLRPVVQ